MLRPALALFLAVLLLPFWARTQDAGEMGADIDPALPEFQFDSLDLGGQLYFLASDYLEGRRTGEHGNEMAAEYIASQLRAYGLEPLTDGSYFQEVPLRRVAPPVTGHLTIGEEDYALGEDFVFLRGPAAEAEGTIVFANYGWTDPEGDHDDYAGLDVEGKIVITRPGIPGEQGQGAIFRGIQQKAEMAAQAGALAILELYNLPFPWQSFRGYVGGERLAIDGGDNSTATIPYGFVNLTDELATAIQQGKAEPRASVGSAGMVTQSITSRNVGGILRGSDPEVADEYMLMTAHFDHVGMGRQAGGPYTPEDSIFNGARDNGIGTVSLLAAARAFAQKRPRRSVVVLAVTGEELGLLGSKYYSDNPVVPLEQTIFNFNTDGGGYNDTSAVSLIGSNRTGIDGQVLAAAEAFDTRVIMDPAPEQGLFDRSDNVSFAVKGIPALSFSPGFDTFDEEIMRYYHQAIDNPENVSLSYLKKYCQIYTLAARLIANRDEVPFWMEGDKYEAAGERLYGVGR